MESATCRTRNPSKSAAKVGRAHLTDKPLGRIHSMEESEANQFTVEKHGLVDL